eukprot:CAMPEP_0182557606 /NCGR_PEP_ID=MMETSP1324-20130603/1455_1 /TAXON_ID=236786 /ORGANISM="Florenciella sp., Strain RCC1587" /LENGTH=74 /DNA_ID=CAMNT_0024769683 /DNA_START=139 /DNA_END=362 /DNA_ORIENTATION=+
MAVIKVPSSKAVAHTYWRLIDLIHTWGKRGDRLNPSSSSSSSSSFSLISPLSIRPLMDAPDLDPDPDPDPDADD